MDKNTTRHSERCYARNSFGLLARRLGFRQNNSVCCNWILRCTQNDGYARKLSFTMAEILLSLTIIGVVAAITLPSLTGNINERTWNTQRKALYARMSQAIALIGNLNGYGIGATESETASNAAKAFITNGLAKVYKINNICDVENIDKCGFTSQVTKAGINSKIEYPKHLHDLNPYFNVDNSTVKYSQLNTDAVAFETGNGESILAFYNPFCGYSLVENPTIGSTNIFLATMCTNFIYDLNGKRGPNKVGMDVGFMTVFYPTDSQVAALTILGAQSVRRINVPEFSIGAGNAHCRKVYNDEARMANIEELKSLFINNKFGYSSSYSPFFLVADNIISSTPTHKPAEFYVIGGASGAIGTRTIDNINQIFTTNVHVFCVK